MAAQKLNMYSKKRINALLLYLIWDDVKRTDVADFILSFYPPLLLRSLMNMIILSPNF